MIMMNILRNPVYICTLALLLLTATNIEGATKVDFSKKAINYYPVEQLVVSAVPSFECGENTQETIKRDCTVRVTTDNMDVEVTFYDVSWWTCAKLKVGAFGGIEIFKKWCRENMNPI
jgi:hypothetical protein